MTIHVPFLLQLAEDAANTPMQLARGTLALACPDGVTDESPAQLAAEILAHAERAEKDAPLALVAAAVTGDAAPGWACSILGENYGAHLTLLRALLFYTARYLPLTPTPHRLLLGALARPCAEQR